MSGSHVHYLQSIDHLLVCKGTADNVMVFPLSDYDNSAFAYSAGQYQFTHKAYGVDMFRYSGNFGRSWANWTNWENITIIPLSIFTNASNFWPGQYVMFQCKAVLSSMLVSANSTFD